MSNLNNGQAFVWLTRRQALPEAELQRQILPLLSISEIDRLNQIQSTKRRQEYLISRALLRHAIAKITGRARHKIHITETGTLPAVTPPIDNCRISISHSHDLVAVAASLHPIGLDVEQLGRIDRAEIQEYINSDDERRMLEGHASLKADERFLFSWCIREAWYKAHASHQINSVAGISLAMISQSGWHNYATRIYNHLCTITVPEPCTFNIYCCTPLAMQRTIYPEINSVELVPTISNRSRPKNGLSNRQR